MPLEPIYDDTFFERFNLIREAGCFGHPDTALDKEHHFFGTHLSENKALGGVLKLAHIPWPVIRHQLPGDVYRNCRSTVIVLLAELADKVLK